MKARSAGILKRGRFSGTSLETISLSRVMTPNNPEEIRIWTRLWKGFATRAEGIVILRERSKAILVRISYRHLKGSEEKSVGCAEGQRESPFDLERYYTRYDNR
ncbi:hypothetical protein MFRU_006g02850 [Monilinia fructicola]|nr:hypothetical protein MFRU_006g02850 [Monilinia fructicola]